MNISNYIQSWSQKIINESINEGKYDPSLDNPDQEKTDDMDNKSDDYEEWQKEREKIMKELQPKSVKEGCCDEGDTEEKTPAQNSNLSSVAIPANPEEGSEEGESPDFGGVDEGMLDNIANWFSDSQHWWNNISKDQKLWTTAVEQVKKSGKTGLKKFSDILLNLTKKNETFNTSIMVKQNDGSLIDARNPIITRFKGLTLLCLAGGDSNKPVDGKTCNIQMIEDLMKKEKVNKLGDFAGIVFVADKKNTKTAGEQDDEKATKNSTVIVDASTDGSKVITLTCDTQSVSSQHDNAGRMQLFAM